MERKITEKAWNKQLEHAVAQQWQKEKLYAFSPAAKKVFVIDTPPPYPSGRPWHIGAAAHYSQIDMIARTARMQGNEVFFPIGIDRNGLPVELYTEKKYNVRIQDTPRERFVELCITALDDLEAEMIEIMKRMGMSGDFENYYRTDSADYRALTQATFIELWKRGLVYVATRPNNYCHDCGTTIADAEILYQEIQKDLLHVRFAVKETGEPLLVATTRPELLAACQAVIYNPDDARYTMLKGMHALVPFYNSAVPIIPHPSARPEFGSGAVMVCSYGDENDARIIRELGLDETMAIDLRGRMTGAAGAYAGMKIAEARKKITSDLEGAGMAGKKEKVVHRTPTCDRSKTPIEIIPMDEFYLKQLDYVADMKAIAEKMMFHPEEHRQILLNWIDAVSIDWPVSRRRFYGTEIPIWYCARCGEAHLPEPGSYVQPWKEKAPFAHCTKCKSKEFVGEERTFDTWFDSSISPLFIAGYRKNKQFFAKAYPNALRPQAKDIIRTWLYYTLLRCWQLTGERPFERAWIMGYGVDERGEKMSKSRGNVIDPIPIIEKYGADAFRFWNAAEASLGSDFRCSEERIAGAGKFLTKLWNVARFISSFPGGKKTEPKGLDKWILNELNIMVEGCRKGYDGYNFFIPANRIRDFVWNVFAPYYIELAKPRAYAGDASALYTLHHCLKTVLKLLAPIAPFSTDYIWHTRYETKSIHTEHFPEAGTRYDVGFTTAELVALNSAIWKFKKEQQLSLKSGIQELVVPEKFSVVAEDLRAAHNAKKIRYGTFSVKI